MEHPCRSLQHILFFLFLFGGEFVLGLLKDLFIVLGLYGALIEPGKGPAAGPWYALALLSAPIIHAAMVAAEEDGGHLAPVPLLRPGILGILRSPFQWLSSV